MTTSTRMTRNINKGLDSDLPARTAGSLSMISIVAISVGMVAAPGHAQEMPAPTPPKMTAPVLAPPVASPQPAPTAEPTITPTIAAPPTANPPAVEAKPEPAVAPERAEDLARRGGFDAETVAPEAMAQIEQEQQERQTAAAKAAEAKTAAVSAGAPERPADAIASNSPAESAVSGQSAAPTDGETVPSSGSEDSAAMVAAASAVRPSTEVTTSPQVLSREADADWGLLAALAALLGVGGAGAYAASRRRKSKGEAATAVPSNEPLPASLTAAAQPDPAREALRADLDPVADQQNNAAGMPNNEAVPQSNFADLTDSLSALGTASGNPDRSVTLGHRRVAAAPKPYLAQADLSRNAGYFTANVDAMPTPQNPFLTRQKRLKRARYLDGKLAALNTETREKFSRVTGEMKVSRPLEPAFS